MNLKYIACMLIFCGAMLMFSCVGVPKETETHYNSAYYELIDLGVEQYNKEPREFSGKYAEFLWSYKAALSGNFDEAIVNMQKLVAKNPDSIYLRNELGALYLHKGDYNKAVEILRIAAQNEPVDPETLYLLGPAYHGLGRLDDAVIVYESILKMPQSKTNAEVYFILSKLYMDTNRNDDARALVLNGSKLFSDNFGFHFILAEIYMEAKQYSRAEESYKKTLRLEPYFFEARFALADLYRETKRLNDLIGVYSDILEYEPENVPAMLGLALAYRDAKRPAPSHDVMSTLAVRAAGDNSLVMSDIYGIYIDKQQYDDALYLLYGILNVNPDTQDLRYLAAVTEQGVGNIEGALKNYLMIQPESMFYINSMIQAALQVNQMGRIDEALVIIQKAMEQKPDNDELFFVGGLLADEHKQTELAAQYVKKAVDLNPQNVQYMLQMGMVLEKLNRQEEAIVYMQRVLEIEPENVSALNYIGYTWADMGVHLNKAQQFIEKALLQSPDDGYIMDSLGWVFYQQGKYSLALEYLLGAHALQPTDPVIAEHLGDTYVKLNQPQQAIGYYEKSLELDANKTRYSLVIQKLNVILKNQ